MPILVFYSLLGRDEARRIAANTAKLLEAIPQDLIRGPSYNGLLVVSATENTHAATAPTCDFCFGYDRTRSLRLHLHAETEKTPAVKREAEEDWVK